MSSCAETDAKFPLGEIVVTHGVLAAIDAVETLSGLQRHQQGDWGDLDKDDRLENDVSLEKGFRLLSAYADRAGTRFYIITEADRSVTTILLPSEY